MSFAIIPQNLSIVAMRSSGYKDSAHALAELIDNSIQAGENMERRIDVEVICVDTTEHQAGGRRRRLNRIAVVDNAAGMNAETLRKALQFGNGSHLAPATQKGIGKFGMGLPNSSISQCRRVDVWTWQGGVVYHTYLALDAIENETMAEVPKPQPAVLPQEWISLFKGDVGESGTLVVWTELDRVTWKRSTALLRNAEFIIGRIYRYFINSDRARIRLACYEESGGRYTNTMDENVRPNDPLYLMTGTSSPSPFDQTPAFQEFGEPQEIEVGYNGVPHLVKITASICKTETRMGGGHASIGQDARKNVGVSVVRAGRELELNRSFENTYDPRERWWGIEVSFEPGLDPIFGVTNNKQTATEFKKIDLEEDAAAQEITVAEYKEILSQDNDPRQPMYEISNAINSLLSTMRIQIARMREGARTDAAGAPAGPTAEVIATNALRRRQEKLGKTGTSDEAEAGSAADRADVLSGEIVQDGIGAERAKEIAVDYVNRKIKFLFRHADFPGFAVFDVTSKAGVIIITINTKHPAHEHLFELLREDSEPETPALQGLKLLLTAWARMEDEASPERKIEFEDTRGEWGKIARDFMREAGE